MNCKVCQSVSTKNQSLSFFRFPADDVRCREWAKRCNILGLYERFGSEKFYKSFRICSQHFDGKYITFDGKKKRLRSCAVPNLVQTDEEKRYAFPESKGSTTCDDTNFTSRLLRNLCRFCAEENTDLTEIFSWKGKTLELEEKIKVLPIAVEKCDKLPLKVCSRCVIKISKFYEFVKNCVKADIRLKTILDVKVSTASLSNHSYDKQVESVGDKTKGEDVKQSNFRLKTEISSNENHENEEAPKSQHLDDNILLEEHENRSRNGGLNEIDVREMEYKTRLRDNPKEVTFNNLMETVQKEKDDYSYVKIKNTPRKTPNDVFERKSEETTLGKHYCNVCSKSFDAFEILESHCKAHSLKPDESGKFVCEVCNKTFPNKYRLNEHNRVHTGTFPYKCPKCDKKFHRMALLKQHSIIHEPRKRFICSLCNLRSRRKGNLIQHLRNHYKNSKNHIRKLKSRNKCVQVYPVLNELSVNEKKEDSNGNFDQPGTEIIFQVKLEHLGIKEEGDRESGIALICGLCQKSFLNLESLEEHFKLHITAKERKCRSCQKIFSQETNTCQVASECQECLRSKSRRRPKIQADKSGYHCDECGATFKRKDTLKNHIRIHTGERPFVCKTCGFAFKQRGDCLKHERNHKSDGDMSECT